jgi:hypothetical protein
MKKEQKEALFRILVAIVSGIVLYLFGALVMFLALVNLVYTLIKNKRNRKIALFCEYFNSEAYKFWKYITGVTNKRPFPFSDLERFGKFES